MPHSALHFHLSRAPSQADRERKKSPSRSASTHTTDTATTTGRKPACDDKEDKASIMSRSTQVSNKPRTEVALCGIAGDRVRHAKCAPEFLEAIAARDDKHVKIITGLEASTFFVKYLGEQDNDAVGLWGTKRQPESRAVVFAVTVWERGRKCVDYYMTWRKKKKDKPLKEEKVTELDEDFRRVSRRIDKDYKAFRRAGAVTSVASSSHSHRSSRKRDRSRSPVSTKKSRPETLPIPAHGHELKPVKEELPEPPASATDSVISLPYLNMIRGVPRGNRLPLFLVNPDRLSTYSEMESPVEITPVADDTTNNAGPDALVIAITPPDTHAPDKSAADHESSGLTPLMKSSASIRSTGTHSSKSSQSSQDSRRSSPPRSPNQKEDTPLPSEDEIKNEFLIVLLGDKLEKEGLSWHGLDRQTSTRSQHRSYTQERSSPWIGPIARADASYYQSHSKARKRSGNDDSDSDGSYDENGWKDSPVVPLKPLLESMGFVPSPGQDLSGYQTPPVIPLGMPYYPPAPPGSMVGSPVPSNARQLRYSTYSASSGYHGASTGSPYAPQWMSLAASADGSPVGSLPPSRAATLNLGGYGSPYMRPAY